MEGIVLDFVPTALRPNCKHGLLTT